MITKELEVKKQCCFYVSDFHLEMILLPHIKKNVKNTKFIICTENDLTDSIKILLDRTNLKDDEKKEIYNLNWKNKKIYNLFNEDLEKSTIIINGSNEYISTINKKIEEYGYKNINIIDCYNINEKNLKVNEIEKLYEQVLNTKGM